MIQCAETGGRSSSLGMSPYSYNSSNQLASTPQATFMYDYNDNTLSKTDSNGTTSYAWDYENRLTSVTLPGGAGVVTFTYDPLGRRVRTVRSSSTIIYVYDGANIVAEYTVTGTVAAAYVQAPAIDEPLAMWRQGTVSYYHADGLGSITSLTDSGGSALAAYTYDAFGQPTASAGSLVNPFRYTGRDWDEETGLFYYRARYYYAGTGRFLSEDPIRFEASKNFYPYVGNNPTTFTDPSGLLRVCCRPLRYPLVSRMWCHCFLELGDGKEQGTTLGGYKDGMQLNKDKNRQDDFPTPPESTCTQLPGGACADQRALQAFDSLPRHLGTYGLAGTSNTVPALTLERAGIPFAFPRCWGANSQPAYGGGGGRGW